MKHPPCVTCGRRGTARVPFCPDHWIALPPLYRHAVAITQPAGGEAFSRSVSTAARYLEEHRGESD